MAAGADKKALPPLPDQVAHVWFAFVDLQATRERSFTIGPITWAEINAYDLGSLAMLTAWEKRLIRRADDAFTAVRLGLKVKPTSVASMKASLRAVIAARNARAAPKNLEDRP